MKNILPKEYILEKPANYDIVKMSKEMIALIHAFTLVEIVNNPSYLFSLISDKDNRSFLVDIFGFMIDTEIEHYDIYSKENEHQFVSRLIAAMSEAGFFG